MKLAAAGPDWLDRRIRRGEVIIIDGATGTELQHRGVPMHGKVWCAAANLSHPREIRQLHEDYIRAGADVIIANTYAAARHALEPAGFGDKVEAINRAAVDAAISARDAAADRPVCIAGSISDFITKPVDSKWLEPETLEATFREQAEQLAAAGVDLIAMEMIQKPEIAIPAIKAAIATGLPVWIGCSCRQHDDLPELTTRDDRDCLFSTTVNEIAGLGAGVITVMHSDVEDTEAGLRAVRERWSGPLGAYPNSGYFTMPNWQFVDVIAPEALVEQARPWIEIGTQIIGGCCGLGPAHVAALRDAFSTRD